MSAPIALSAAGSNSAPVLLTPLERNYSLGLASVASRFGNLVVSELRLMLKGHAWWWYIVAAGLIMTRSYFKTLRKTIMKQAI